MEKTPGGWMVIDREAGVLALSYSFAKGGIATTFTARMKDGKMLVVSPAVGLTDAAAAELLEFGEVGAIVANNGFHHLGQVEWRARFPEARCFAPSEAMARIRKKNPKAGDFEPLSALEPLLAEGVGIREVAQTKCGESWAWAKIEGGYAWYTSDVLINLSSLPKALPAKFLFWASKSGPGFSVFNLALKFIVKDKKATLRTLLEDVEAHSPKVMVPAHGSILSQATLAEDTQKILRAAV